MQVRFNHLYVVLDDKTYQSVIGSSFLHTAFPGFERRTTHTAADETWSGAYFYGRDTYLEFFPAAGGHWMQGAGQGWAGLAFTVDEPGGAQEAAQALQSVDPNQPDASVRRVLLEGRPVNWFYTAHIADTLKLDSFDAWVSEYHPDIFAQRGIPPTPDGRLTTAAYLEKWNRPRPVQAQPSAFSNVTGATIALGAAEAGRFAHVLATLGYAQSTNALGQTTLSAHGFTLTLDSAGSQGSANHLRAVTLALSRPYESAYSFIFAPHSRLDIPHTGDAVWTFG